MGMRGWGGATGRSPDKFTKIGFPFTFYTQPHDAGGVIWFQVGRPCVSPSFAHAYFRSRW